MIGVGQGLSSLFTWSGGLTFFDLALTTLCCYLNQIWPVLTGSHCFLFFLKCVPLFLKLSVFKMISSSKKTLLLVSLVLLPLLCIEIIYNCLVRVLFFSNFLFLVSFELLLKTIATKSYVLFPELFEMCYTEVMAQI